MRIKGFGDGGGDWCPRRFVGFGALPSGTDAGAFHEGFEHYGEGFDNVWVGTGAGKVEGATEGPGQGWGKSRVDGLGDVGSDGFGLGAETVVDVSEPLLLEIGPLFVWGFDGLLGVFGVGVD